MSLSHRRQPPSQLGSPTVSLSYQAPQVPPPITPLNPLPRPGSSMNPPPPRPRASSLGDYISGCTGDGVRLFTPTYRVARSGIGPTPCSGKLHCYIFVWFVLNCLHSFTYAQSLGGHVDSISVFSLCFYFLICSSPIANAHLVGAYEAPTNTDALND